jgi:hypothetical protein
MQAMRDWIHTPPNQFLGGALPYIAQRIIPDMTREAWFDYKHHHGWEQPASFGPALGDPLTLWRQWQQRGWI